MGLIEDLKSDKTIVKTTLYNSNSSGTHGSVSNDANATSARNNDVPIIVDPIQPWELAQQETRRNRIVTRLFNSRNELSKVAKKQDLENRLSQIRYELGFKDIIALQEKLSVSTPVPLEIFTDWAVSLVTEIAHSLQVKIEAVVPALLGAIFIGARGNYVIKVNNNYQEPLTEYIIITMQSGGGKSAIVNFFRKPINDHEAELQFDFDANATIRKINREVLDSIKRKVISKGTAKLYLEPPEKIILFSQVLSEKLESVVGEIQQLKARPKLLTDSPTSKKLSMDMAQNGESIGIFEAEGGIWKHRLRPSDDNIYLKGYTMEPFGDETM